MQHTFTATLDDEPGALERVLALFRKRAFNIRSLTVDATQEPGVSRLTLVVDGDEAGLRRASGGMEKLLQVHGVDRQPSKF
ncbi:MAG TPA: acetolactate synthase small subunit [Holophagaceae bacterium]|jgi:acetolactate synthase-1/3 small subunit|nr:acetolactate synthase small subunit [Holophagaceae bacterium]